MHTGRFAFKSGKRVVIAGIVLSLFLIFGGIVTFICLVQHSAKADEKANRQKLLKIFTSKLELRLKKDLNETVPEWYIDKVFSSPELKFFPNLMVKRLTWKEAKLPYAQFLEKDRIKRAYQFLKTHEKLLDEIEKKFGVDKEVVTAIFLVETNLGKNTGKFPVFNVFYSLALSGNPLLIKPYAEKKGVSLSDPKVINFIKKRSNWAYKELLYLIQISYRNHWNPFEVKGSIFGAFGYPQFVPKSYIIYGYDWNKDGVVDLYQVEDALASIANYLYIEGYKMDSSLEEKKKIIMKYNISEPYANTVLKVAEKLKELETKSGGS